MQLPRLSKMARKLIALSTLQLLIIHLAAQPLSKKEVFTHADTLRGTYGPSRDWWDVTKYDINVKVNIPDSTIAGNVRILFKSLKKGKEMQVDLQEPMIIDSIEYTVSSGKAKPEKNGKVSFNCINMPTSILNTLEY